MKALFKQTLTMFSFCLALAACSSGEENAVISISLGMDSAPEKAAISIDQLNHIVTLSGAAGSQTHTISGAGTVKATVTPGLWNIRVEGYYGEELYSTGMASAEVKAGQTTNVSIHMNVVWTDSPAGSGNGGGGKGGNGVDTSVSVTISPPTAVVTKGQTQQFSATVGGTTNQSVTWTLSGSTVTGTDIDTGGLLTVSTGESDNNVFYVTATSDADASKSATARVTVTAAINAIAPSLGGLPTTSQDYPASSTATPLTATVANEPAILAGGGTLAYQWYSSATAPGTPPAGGTALSGETNATFNPPTGTVGTSYYWVVVTNTVANNGDGGQKVVDTPSNPVTVWIHNGALTGPISFDPSPSLTGKTYSVGDILTVNTTATTGSGNWTYEWKRDATIIGTNNPSYTIAAGDWPGNITVTVSCSNNTGTVDSNSIAVYMPVANYTDLDGISTIPNQSRNYILIDDIDIPGTWTPFNFSGIFDGNGKTIDFQGVTVIVGHGGLFSNLTGEVKNLILTGDISSTSTTYLGAVAGYNEGIIRNVSSSVNVTSSYNSTSATGGIVGSNGSNGGNGLIENCYSTGNVSSTYTSNNTLDAIHVGGIAGLNFEQSSPIPYNGSIKYCWASGDVSAENNPTNSAQHMVGGIAGSNQTFYGGFFSNCVALNDNLTSINAATFTLGRIVCNTSFDTGVLTDNFGNEDMNPYSASWPTADNNGTDVPILTIETIGGTWWTGAGGPGWTFSGTPDEDNPWKWDTADSRPILWFETALNQ